MTKLHEAFRTRIGELKRSGCLGLVLVACRSIGVNFTPQRGPQHLLFGALSCTYILIDPALRATQQAESPMWSYGEALNVGSRWICKIQILIHAPLDKLLALPFNKMVVISESSPHKRTYLSWLLHCLGIHLGQLEKLHPRNVLIDS